MFNGTFMHIIDISWPISGTMTAYKNEKTVAFTPLKKLETDGARKTQITLDTHTGTHVDTPAHFIKDGATSDATDLETLAGPCVVIDLSRISSAITAADLEEYDLEECDILLIKTKNSALATDAPFDVEFVYLDASAATYLAEMTDVQTVGFDYLGIERNQPKHDTHQALFEADITIVEGLRLAAAAEGEYFFVCLPLALKDLDGAPARAILVQGL
jgi:arylformamidase